MNARACLRRKLCLVAASVSVGYTLGCSSVYHDVARHAPGAIGERLDLRREQAIAAHEGASKTLAGMIQDLREQRAVRTRAARVERLQRERIELGQQIWEARKAIASIEDVVVMDDRGEIPDAVRTEMAGVMGLLEQASDELDRAQELTAGQLAGYAQGAGADPETIDAIGERNESARSLIDRARRGFSD